MEANAGLAEEDVVNYARAYDGKIILLFELGVTHDHFNFQRRCYGKVSPLHQHDPHPCIKCFLCVHGPIPFLVRETENTVARAPTIDAYTQRSRIRAITKVSK